MLSYRHEFHAGNHADVLKHICLIALLQLLTRKDKPLCYFDTHAGAGAYDLSSDFAQKNQEFRSGIHALWDYEAKSALLQDYLRIIRAKQKNVALQHYPGSPLIAAQLLRSQDHAMLCELHPTDGEQLKRTCRRFRQLSVHQCDGFQAIESLLPPVQKRGLVLIDPSYEIKKDYSRTADAVAEIQRRFRSACIAVWYPRLAQSPAQAMLERLIELGEHAHYVLDVAPKQGHGGMYGSGMFILNPPWKLDELVMPALSELRPQLRGWP